MLTGSIGYTSRLTEEIIRRAEESEAVKAQKADEATDIFTGLPFKAAGGDMSNEEKQDAFKSYVNGRDEAGKAAVYASILALPSEETLQASVEQIMGGMTRADMETTLTQALTQKMGMSESAVAGYLSGMSDEDLTAAFRKQVEEQVTAQYAAGAAAQLAGKSPAQLAAAMTAALDTYTP